ncbi:hypothetical protein ACHAXH_005953 [Discostella pseudostelligera]
MPSIHFRHRTTARHDENVDEDNVHENDIGSDNRVGVGVGVGSDNDAAKLRRRHKSISLCRCRRIVFVAIVIALALSILLHADNGGGLRITVSSMNNSIASNDNNDEENAVGCTFRSYPISRLYGLSSVASQLQQQKQPDFLVRATYIRGHWPIVLNPMENENDNHRQTHPSKVCINTASWEQTTSTKNGTNATILSSRLPFTDGQNPSIVSLAAEPYSYSPHALTTTRLDHRHLHPLLPSLSMLSHEVEASLSTTSFDNLFLGAMAFGSGQCRFGLIEEDELKKEMEIGPPGGKRAVIYVLAAPDINDNDRGRKGRRKEEKQQQNPPSVSSSLYFRTLAQSTLHLERNAKYGTSRKAIPPLQSDESSSNNYARIQLEFDDPRLFFHHGRIWILYRNGPFPFRAAAAVGGDGSGGSGEDGKFFTAFVKASESIIIRGGRNIALISEEPMIGGTHDDGKVRWNPPPKLKALTWVDPVTVVEDIDLRGIDKRLSLMTANEEEMYVDGVNADSNGNDGGVESRHGRRLRSERQHRTATTTKSNIHGTNGYMIPLATTGELLGIAHFHRPEDRRPSEYALHGHHYTHAFFTIARDDAVTNGDNSTTGQRYKLKRLSNEFVFRTNSIPEGMTRPPSDDGDIIQFASGLDLLGSDIDGRAIISYGINDCEGAVFTLSMRIMQQMLIEVQPGQEVVDLMMEIGN